MSNFESILSWIAFKQNDEAIFWNSPVISYGSSQNCNGSSSWIHSKNSGALSGQWFLGFVPGRDCIFQG